MHACTAAMTQIEVAQKASSALDAVLGCVYNDGMAIEESMTTSHTLNALWT